MSALLAFLTSRIGLGLIAGVFLISAITLGWSAGVANRDKAQAERQVAKLDDQINNPVTGYIPRLTQCQSNLAGAEISINTQNEAIRRLQVESEQATARSQASIRAAQDRARAAERKTQSILQQHPRDGEPVCEAAWRLHSENLQ